MPTQENREILINRAEPARRILVDIRLDLVHKIENLIDEDAELKYTALEDEIADKIKNSPSADDLLKKVEKRKMSVNEANSILAKNKKEIKKLSRGTIEKLSKRSILEAALDLYFEKLESEK